MVIAFFWVSMLFYALMLLSSILEESPTYTIVFIALLAWGAFVLTEIR